MRPHATAARICDDAAESGFALDADQVAAVEAMTTSTRGVYLHGPVGRGKSWIADAFHRHSPVEHRRRVHFHGFLDELHRAVFARQTAIRERRLAVVPTPANDAEPVVITTGPHSAADVLTAAPRTPTPDPIAQGLADVIGPATLLVFDEFHVHDTGDARLLTRLLEHALAHDIRIVATSNYAPDDLLPDPVWHHIAEPGIQLIKEHMAHVHLDGGRDYRASARRTAGFAEGSWRTDAPAAVPAGARSTRVRDRAFEVTAATDDELWITFAQLCEQPTSTIEYLEWARAHARWTVLDVPPFDEVPLPAQQRFLNAVDVLVDADVPTTFVSPTTLDEFGRSARARPDADRLLSRLSLLREVAR
ncbi:AFG1/ZapE family ATPase [Microbacterium sp. G2-8]|uniref:AFG1/ZapE family ATPase n=1 Tax=Microbacterium sp. G2-8 TaxID=2842454 RepID=UPI001C895D41|nr:AFG1/ZapE family ATPase [Microbacterium sp. G2-8]